MKIFIGILSLIIIFFVLKTLSPKVQYYVYCETGNCSEKSLFDKREFYVNKATQTVTMKQNGMLSTLSGCSVFDKKNWTCVTQTSKGDDIRSYRNKKYSHYPIGDDVNQLQLSYPVWLFRKIFK